MKNFFAKIMVAALFCGASVVANAQEIVVIQTTDSSQVEFAPEVYSAAANYQNWQNERGLRRWYVKLPVGNNTQVEPVLWSAKREGPYLGVGVNYARFDGYDLIGPKAEVGYMRKNYGVSLALFGGRGHEARSSERQANFLETDVIGRIYSPALEFKVGKDVADFRAYLGVSFKKRWDFHKIEAQSVEIEETDDEWITTTTTTQRNLDARPHVLGWEAGVRFTYSFWGSPLKISVGADYGKSKNFTYVEQQILDQVKADITVHFTIGNSHGYAKATRGSQNSYLYEDYGYEKNEVKVHNW